MWRERFPVRSWCCAKGPPLPRHWRKNSLWIPVRELGLYVGTQRRLGGTHRNHVVESVAPMDIHIMRNRPQPVRRVEVAISFHMRKPPPQAFAFVLCQNGAQVVEISCLSMSNFPEDTIPHHAQHHHLGVTVTAVLQDDAMLASSLGSVDNVPTLLQGRAGRHFDGRMLTIFHRGQRHRNVPVPWRRDVDDIKVELSQILEVQFTLAEATRLSLACIRDSLLRLRHF